MAGRRCVLPKQNTIRMNETTEPPDTSDETPAYKSFLTGTEPVTADDLREALPEQDYETLTIGDDRNAVHCLLAAKLRAKADIQSTGNVYDEAVPEIRLALMKLWLYELFAFVGQSDKAHDAYEDYTLIIKTSFGAIHTKGEDNAVEQEGPAVACIKPAKNGGTYGRYGR